MCYSLFIWKNGGKYRFIHLRASSIDITKSFRQFSSVVFTWALYQHYREKLNLDPCIIFRQMFSFEFDSQRQLPRSFFFFASFSFLSFVYSYPFVSDLYYVRSTMCDSRPTFYHWINENSTSANAQKEKIVPRENNRVSFLSLPFLTLVYIHVCMYVLRSKSEIVRLKDLFGFLYRDKVWGRNAWWIAVPKFDSWPTVLRCENAFFWLLEKVRIRSLFSRIYIRHKY